MDTNDQQAINGTFSGASGIDSDPYRLRPLFETPLIRYQDRIAIRTEQTALTYRKLDRQSDALAAALIERGIDVGDRIALLMANQAMFAVADLAIVKADAARVPINDMLTPDEIETILSDSGVSTVLTGESFIETITDLRAQLPDLETVIATTDQTELPDSIQRLESLVDEYSPPPELDVTPSPDDTAGVFYTGGTTGKPKGVVHTQRGLAMNLYAHLAEVDITGDDTLLLSTPLSHSAGMFLWSGLLAGAMIVVHDGFDRERVLEEIDANDITWTFMVPTMIYRLLDTDALETYDTMSLETILYGAAPMTAKRLRDGIDAFGPIFMQFYGQTEVPNLITTFGKDEHEQCLETSDDTRLSSAGHPTLMSDVRVVGIQTGDDVQPGDKGEILATAPYVMDRYHDHPEATAEMLSSD